VSYKIRNSIVLGVLILIVIAIGAYATFFYQPKKIKQYVKDTESIAIQLQDNSEQLNAISDTQTRLRETIHRWNNRIKEIDDADISSQTYGYLSDIIDESGGQQLRMNMSLTGTHDGGQIGYNIYKLTGTSEFANIFRFLWLLENGRKLYKVPTITIRSDEIGVDSMEYPRINLSYEMEIQAFFSKEVSLGMSVTKPDSTPQPVTANPFQPSILGRTPVNVRKLLNVDFISVKATANGKALVMAEDGRLITVKVGDEVFLGRVTGINPQEGSMEFTLNDGGIIITKKKFIEFGKDKGLNP
jgi:hypothetical protein